MVIKINLKINSGF